MRDVRLQPRSLNCSALPFVFVPTTVQIPIYKKIIIILIIKTEKHRVGQNKKFKKMRSAKNAIEALKEEALPRKKKFIANVYCNTHKKKKKKINIMLWIPVT